MNIFQIVYRRWKRRKLQNRLSKIELSELFGREGIHESVVNEIKSSEISEQIGFTVQIGEDLGFFPLYDAREMESKRGGLTVLRSNFMAVESVVPPFLPNGPLSAISSAIASAKDQNSKYKIIDSAFTEMYPLETLAGYYHGKYLKQPAIQPYNHHILEAIETFTSGFRIAPISLLLPVIEGVIRNLGVRIGVSTGHEVSKKGLITVLDTASERAILDIKASSISWVPSGFTFAQYFDCFSERVQVIQSLRRYVDERLYADTRAYGWPSRLNRHGILHGFMTDFESPSNFFRLITVLNVLAFVSVFVERVGNLWGVDQDEEIEKYARHLDFFRSIGNLRKRNLERLGVGN